MKKLLFTIQWYGIPSSIAASANTLCDENVIEELKRSKNYEIHILSYGVSGFPLEEKIDGVFVHRFKRGLLWDYSVRNRANHTLLYKSIVKFRRFIMRVKQVVFIPIFPNYDPLLTNKFERKAINLQKKYNFDLVFSEFNGIDSVYAGLAIKKRFPSVKYIPLCWDSISGGRLANFLPRTLCLKLRRRAEDKVMSYADSAVVMRSSKRFHDENTSKYAYYNKFIFLDVPYFIVRKNIESKELRNPVNVLYAGTMSDRSPKPLFDVLSLVDYCFDFLFICHSEFHKDLMDYNGVYKNIKVHCLPYMSHAELQNYQENSDILVNFGVSNLNAVSGKIFDYMSTGKPIISTSKFSNEACIPYLEKYPLAFVMYEYLDKSINAKKIEEFLEKIKTNRVDIDSVKDNFVENNPKTYVHLFEQLIDAK